MTALSQLPKADKLIIGQEDKFIKVQKTESSVNTGDFFIE
jgi:hypothetical protein